MVITFLFYVVKLTIVFSLPSNLQSDVYVGFSGLVICDETTVCNGIVAFGEGGGTAPTCTAACTEGGSTDGGSSNEDSCVSDYSKLSDAFQFAKANPGHTITLCEASSIEMTSSIDFSDIPQTSLVCPTKDCTLTGTRILSNGGGYNSYGLSISDITFVTDAHVSSQAMMQASSN